MWLTLETDGHYLVGAPRMVGGLSSYFRGLRECAGPESTALAGFDFNGERAASTGVSSHAQERELERTAGAAGIVSSTLRLVTGHALAGTSARVLNTERTRLIRQ